MKKIYVPMIFFLLLVLSACGPQFGQYTSQDQKFSAVMPDVKNVLTSCQTENQVKSCMTFASSQNVGFFILSDQDLSGGAGQFAGANVASIATTLAGSLCGFPLAPGLSRATVVNQTLAIKSGNYPAAHFVGSSCPDGNPTEGYVFVANGMLYRIYVKGKNVGSADQETHISTFFSSFTTIP